MSSRAVFLLLRTKADICPKEPLHALQVCPISIELPPESLIGEESGVLSVDLKYAEGPGPQKG